MVKRSFLRFFESKVVHFLMFSSFMLARFKNNAFNVHYVG